MKKTLVSLLTFTLLLTFVSFPASATTVQNRNAHLYALLTSDFQTVLFTFEVYTKVDFDPAYSGAEYIGKVSVSGTIMKNIENLYSFDIVPNHSYVDNNQSRVAECTGGNFIQSTGDIIYPVNYFWGNGCW